MRPGDAASQMSINGGQVTGEGWIVDRTRLSRDLILHKREQTSDRDSWIVFEGELLRVAESKP
jgi:hypothetical protein